jgi:outer membrane protein assembly factor BamE (lipoprotein component of BamABCDE complex)
MKRWFVPVALIFSICVMLCGCASVGTQINQAQTEQIKKGVTTREECIQWFGDPTSVAIDGSGRHTATWIYSEAKNRAQNFIPVVGLIDYKLDTKTQTLTVVFDDHDVVVDFVFNSSTGQVNAGLAN